MQTGRFIVLWLLTSVLHAAPKTEQTFKDPITGKSGRYTMGSPAKNQGLLLFFHGSGNSSGYAGVFDPLARIASDHNLVPIALQAPNNAITWPEGPNAPNNQHVAYVRSFLEREIFLKHPDIDRKRIYFVGFSAGSTFLSGDFLPAAISEFQGGAVLLCGGGGPLSQSPAVSRKLTELEARQFKLYFYIQKNDFLYQQTHQGVRYWQSRGLKVQSETPDGGGHCAFDFQQELNRGIRAVINQ